MSDVDTYLLRIFTEHADVNPDLDELAAWTEDMIALREAGKTAEAIAIGRKLIAYDPKLYAGYVTLGTLLYPAGEVAEARYFMHEGVRRARWAFSEGEVNQETVDEIEQLWGEMDPSAYAGLSTQTLVEAQVNSFDWPDAALLREILARGAEAVPHLHQVLKDDDTGLYHSDFACKLLTALFVEQHIETAAQAIPEMVRFYRKTESDWLEFVGSYLAAFGPRVIDPLLEVHADATLDWYQRGTALNAAVAAAGQSEAARERVLAHLRQQLSDAFDREQTQDSDMHVAVIIAQLADYRDEVTRGLVERAFDLELPSPDYIDRDEYDRRFSEEPTSAQPFNTDWLEEYTKEYEAAVYEPDLDYLLSDVDVDGDDEAESDEDDADPEGFSDEQLKELDALLSDLKVQRRLEALREQPLIISEPVEPLTPAPKAAQPGRNDPCWCGSGKKYKHCHLRADDAKA